MPSMSTRSDIQKLDIAVFNRPADPIGLEHWEGQVADNGGNPAAIADAFGASDEYRTLSDGPGDEEVVNRIHRNLFGRDAGAADLAFWTDALDRGTAGAGDIAYAMIQGAEGDDARVLANRATVAEAFTAALDTTVEVLSDAADAAAQAARALLSGVDATMASVEAALAAIPAQIERMRGPQDETRQTVTLTGDVDTIQVDPDAMLLSMVVREDSTVGNLSGGSLDMLYITGPGALTVTNVGTTVRAVSAAEAEGAVRIDLTTTDTARMLGGRGDDVFTGGGAADFLSGGEGSDKLDGDAGADTYEFASSGAENGTDTITFEAGPGGDILGLGGFFLGPASVERNGATGTAIHAFTAADKDDVNITNKVALYSGLEVGLDPHEVIADLINGAGDAFRLTAGGKTVLVTGDASGTSQEEAQIWFLHDMDGTGAVAADEVSLVGLTSSAFDLDTLTTTNFSFDFVTIAL